MTLANPDHAVKTGVLAELAWKPTSNADHIGVAARDGIVTLSGDVESLWQKHAAEVAVSRAKGVKGILVRLDVPLPQENCCDDAGIVAASVNRHDWDPAVPPYGIKVQVKDGFVTLTGMAPHQFQRKAAETALRPLWGVTGFANQIGNPIPAKPANPNRIADDIRRALNLGWFVADTVHVAMAGEFVTLTGSAETLRDRVLAVETAWAVPGTVEVDNHIRIG